MAIIKISSPGDLKNIVIAVPGLDTGDTIDGVTGSSSHSALTVTGAPSTASYTIEGTTYTAGQAIVMDLVVASGQDEVYATAFLSYTTAPGTEALVLAVPVLIQAGVRVPTD